MNKNENPKNGKRGIIQKMLISRLFPTSVKIDKIKAVKVRY